MNIYAIGDLHLPGNSRNKSMDIFGAHWCNHFDKIRDDWQNRVKDDDIVLIPGDISWAMNIDDAKNDIRSISELNGRKVILKGNHDFWWNSLNKVRSISGDTIYFLQNNIVELDDFIFGGSRGWLIPCENVQMAEADKKIYLRELNRLELSLQGFEKSKKKKIALIHYPPLLFYNRETGFTKIFEKYNVEEVVYGHLHGASIETAFSGFHNGINYTLCSADALDFKLKKIKKDYDFS